MTAEENKKFYLAQLPSKKQMDELLEMAERIFLEDIFKYQKDSNYAESINNKLLKASNELDKFVKYIKKTPANKIFIDEKFF